MAEIQETVANTAHDKTSGGASTEPQAGQQEESSQSWFETPSNLGNKAGTHLQQTLNPINETLGKGLETVTKPIGDGIVDPIVGGVMKTGKAVGEQTGVGYGNYEGGPAESERREGERMKKPVGGEEQTAQNPLGLHNGGT